MTNDPLAGRESDEMGGRGSAELVTPIQNRSKVGPGKEASGPAGPFRAGTGRGALQCSAAAGRGVGAALPGTENQWPISTFYLLLIGLLGSHPCPREREGEKASCCDFRRAKGIPWAKPGSDSPPLPEWCALHQNGTRQCRNWIVVLDAAPFGAPVTIIAPPPQSDSLIALSQLKS